MSQVTINAIHIYSIENAAQWDEELPDDVKKMPFDEILMVDSAGNAVLFMDDIEATKENNLFPVKAYRLITSKSEQNG